MTNGDALVTGATGKPSIAIIINDYSNGNDMFVAAPGIASVKDMKGKKVGVEQGFVSHLLVLKALEANGMTEDDVEIVNTPNGETPQVLKSGAVSAIAAWQPSSGQALKLVDGSIEEGRETVASLLKSRGYHTACVGKWHLGMDWVKFSGKEVSDLNIEKADQVNSVDFTQPASNGPTSLGFDEYFGISASLDMVPYVFIENDRSHSVHQQPARCSRFRPETHPRWAERTE